MMLLSILGIGSFALSLSVTFRDFTKFLSLLFATLLPANFVELSKDHHRSLPGVLGPARVSTLSRSHL